MLRVKSELGEILICFDDFVLDEGVVETDVELVAK